MADRDRIASLVSYLRTLGATEDANAVKALTAERDALLAMVECCRELVVELDATTGETYAARELAEIVGWPVRSAQNDTDGGDDDN